MHTGIVTPSDLNTVEARRHYSTGLRLNSDSCQRAELPHSVPRCILRLRMTPPGKSPAFRPRHCDRLAVRQPTDQLTNRPPGSQPAKTTRTDTSRTSAGDLAL